MDEQKRNRTLTPDEEVAMILSSDEDDGPSTSKRVKLMPIDQASSSSSSGDEGPSHPSGSRSIGHGRQIWDDSSDSDSSVDMDRKVYPNVEAYLESIPKFDLREHARIPFYMEILGDNANQIQTELPRSNHYTDEEMQLIKNNFILDQLDFLIRINVRRTVKEARNESRRMSLVKPLATVAREQGYKSE